MAFACWGARQSGHEPVMKFVIALSVGVVVAVGASAAWAVTPYPPGTTAVLTGTHVRCTIALTSVSCTKAGGLTATVAQSGTVHVTRGSRTLFSAGKPIQVHVNGGFATTGSNDENVYCHAYRAGVLTLSCSVNGGSLSSTYKPNSHCFDISDRSVVVCRYDRSGSQRHDIKTFPQP